MILIPLENSTQHPSSHIRPTNHAELDLSKPL